MSVSPPRSGASPVTALPFSQTPLPPSSAESVHSPAPERWMAAWLRSIPSPVSTMSEAFARPRMHSQCSIARDVPSGSSR